MKALNFGSLNLDYVYQVDHFVRPGETLDALHQTVNPGGKESCRGSGSFLRRQRNKNVEIRLYLRKKEVA